MTPADLPRLVTDFYTERLALLQQHEASARSVSDYDVNNAYQYVISREETHVSWLQHALLDLGASLPAAAAPVLTGPTRKEKNAGVELAGADARDNQRFVDKWRERVEQVTNARHRGMLRVVLGEMLEHKRIFEQAAQGRTDIIGTALPIHERRGKVLGTRWLE